MYKISQSQYRNVESVVLESQSIRTEFIYTGGRMVSLIDKDSGREFLLQGKDILPKDCFDRSYADSNPAGFDDMFPTILECYYEDFPWKGIKAADHGEVWSLDWDFKVSDDYVDMSVNGIRFPYTLIKKIFFKDEKSLRIEYEVVNKSQFDMKFLWTAHPMIYLEEGSRIFLPIECKTGYTIACNCGRIGSYGEVFILDKALHAKRDKEVEIIVRDRKTNDSEKYYIREKLSNGYCRVEYPSIAKELEINFSTQTLPYIAVLVTEEEAGCWGIIEPATSLYDRPDVANQYNSAAVIKAKGSYKWFLELNLIG